VTEHGEIDKLDRLVADLQREIDHKEQALYSAKVLQQARNPTNLGCMEAPDAHAVVTGSCGDTMAIYLRLNGSTIQEATFMTDGCGSSLACGNMLTRMVQGMPLEEANEVNPEDLTLALDGLPEESAHCAKLAVNTLRQAIAQYHQERRIGPK
jgi:nitrogen fixation NifU-like protein